MLAHSKQASGSSEAPTRRRWNVRTRFKTEKIHFRQFDARLIRARLCWCSVRFLSRISSIPRFNGGLIEFVTVGVRYWFCWATESIYIFDGEIL